MCPSFRSRLVSLENNCVVAWILIMSNITNLIPILEQRVPDNNSDPDCEVYSLQQFHPIWRKIP